MLLLLYTTMVLLVLYGMLFWYYWYYWNKIPIFEAAKIVEGAALAPKISVIIAARNEASCIARCIASVCRQQYPKHLIQLIIIDDGSTDNTFEIASQIKDDAIQMECIKLEPVEHNRAPKKRAIEKGISVANGTLIATTDADCIAEPDWLNSIAGFYQQTRNVLIAAPVNMEADASILSKFQALDFLTMQGITGAGLYHHFHYMCNGANLAYEKSVFNEVGGFEGIDNIASGDDMLLMQKIATVYPGHIGFLKSPAAIVKTEVAANWNAFLQQRIRWASKATHYQQPKMFSVLLLVYCTNLLMLALLVGSFFNIHYLTWFIVLCFIKFLLEFYFVAAVARFFKQTALLPWLLVLQPLHILYIVISGFLGQVKSYEWKGRRLK